MGDLTKHFDRKEFRCRCGCGNDNIDIRLVQKLENLRTMLGDKPIHINCGCRCFTHNIRVGGVDNSQHLCGHAADIRVEGVAPSKVAAVAELVGFGGIGIYKTFVHLDIRTKGKARWLG